MVIRISQAPPPPTPVQGPYSLYVSNESNTGPPGSVSTLAGDRCDAGKKNLRIHVQRDNSVNPARVSRQCGHTARRLQKITQKRQVPETQGCTFPIVGHAALSPTEALQRTHHPPFPHPSTAHHHLPPPAPTKSPNMHRPCVRAAELRNPYSPVLYCTGVQLNAGVLMRRAGWRPLQQ